MNDKKAYVCILQNSLYKSYVKITATKISPVQYAVELSENRAVPTPFVVAHHQVFYNYENALENIYKNFKKNKISGKNFFSVDLKELVNYINELAINDFQNELKKKNITENDFKSLEKELIRGQKKIERQTGQEFEQLKRDFKTKENEVIQFKNSVISKEQKIQKLFKEIQNLEQKQKKEIERLKLQSAEKEREFKRLTNKLNDMTDNFITSDLLSESELNKTKKFDSIKKAMADAKNVFRLYLWNSNLTTVSSRIASFKNLQELYLWNNQLSTLPSEISSLLNLQKLFLSENKFNTLPNEVLDIKNLERLDFRSNNFIFLTGEINRLNKLKTLYLSNNRLTTLPDELAELPYLEELDLRNNPISSEEKKRLKILLPKVEIRF